MSSFQNVPPLSGSSIRWCLALTLLTPLAEKLSAQPRLQLRNSSRPIPPVLPVVNQGYLATAQPLTLRFAASRAPLPEVGMPVTSPTSRYAADAALAATESANQDAALLPPESNPSTANEVIKSDETTTTKPVPKVPSRIIPDDVIREVPPEELIPYFELPGGNGSKLLVPLNLPSPPTPQALPRSSATFEQQ